MSYNQKLAQLITLSKSNLVFIFTLLYSIQTLIMHYSNTCAVKVFSREQYNQHDLILDYL